MSISLEQKKENLSKLIKEELDKSGKMQRDLVFETGLSASTISSWLRKSQFPDEENRKKLAAALGYTIGRLEAEINGEPYRNHPVVNIDAVKDFVNFCDSKDFVEIWKVVEARISKMMAEA